MPTPQISKKKLKAIVFTDIADFTKLSSQDEQKALDLLQTQNEIVKPIVEKHKGEWLKEIGDGLLLSFDSSLDAVRCSIEIQESLRDVEDLNLRIGIHQGDIFINDDDVIGDDVNVASRIESFSAVGGIAISDKVQRDISSTPEYTTKYIGQPKLKGVSQEVKVYCITSHGLPETKLSDVSAKLEKKTNWFKYAVSVAAFVALLTYYFIPKEKEVPSIGILMMENLGIEDNNFWSRGITEDLIVKVAGAGLIRVAPMREILGIDPAVKLEEIAKKLRVKYLLTSSMHKKEEGFDLRCQLIEAGSGVSQYSNKWSLSNDEAPSIVVLLAENILKSLNVVSKSANAAVPTANIDAYEFYLKGKYRFEMSENIEDTEIARGLLRKAIGLDGNLIPARNVLGWTYHRTGKYDDAKEIYEEALNLANGIDDTLWISKLLNNIGIIYAKKSDYVKALEYYTRSLEMKEVVDDKRGIGRTLNNIGNIYRGKGHYVKAMDFYARSLEIKEKIDEKRNIRVALNNIGICLLIKGEYEGALDYFTRSLDIYKELGDKWDIEWVLKEIGTTYFLSGNFDKAIDPLEKSISRTKEIGLEEKELLEPIVYLFLSYKYAGRKYNLKEIYVLLEKTEQIGYEVNYHLFKLLEENIYLETAYTQVKERANKFKPDVRAIFFGYSIPKAIIEEWENIPK